MADASNDVLIAKDLGELKGQMRELIHTINGVSGKVDGLGIRLGKLEVEQGRRDGAATVVLSILRSPLVGWIVGLAISAWAVLTGKVHI